MRKSWDRQFDRFISASLLAAGMLALFALALQPFLPRGDVERAAELLLPHCQANAAPEPGESLLYILLCLAAVPAAFSGWHLAAGISRKIPDAAGLLLIPLWWMSGGFGTPLIPALPAAGALLLFFTRKFHWEKKLQTGKNWPVYLCLLLAVILSLSRRFPHPADLEHPYGDHMNIVLYALNSAVHGLPDIHLYGFYPAFLAPVFRITGMSLLNVELVMNLLYLFAFALLADAARRLIRQDLLLFGFLVTAAWFCGNSAFLIRRSDMFDPYFAYWPVRFLLPALALNLVSRRNVPALPVWTGILSAAALWFNPDTGIAVAGALFAVHLFSGKLRRALLFPGVFLIFLPAWGLLLYLVNGFPPDVPGYLDYMRTFWRAGYMMLPIQGTPIWMLPVLIMGSGLVWSLKKWPVPAGNAPVLFLSVLGAGLFNYYIGRSHPNNLYQCFWPAVLLLFYFADRVRFRRETTYLAVLFLGLTSVAAVPVKSPRILSGIDRLVRIFYLQSESDRKVITIRELAGNAETVNILPKYQQGFFYAETGLKPGIANFGLSELLFRKDHTRILRMLKNSNAPLILTQDLDLAPELQRFYRLVRTDPELRVRLYLPVNPREGPVLRPQEGR